MRKLTTIYFNTDEISTLIHRELRNMGHNDNEVILKLGSNGFVIAECFVDLEIHPDKEEHLQNCDFQC